MLFRVIARNNFKVSRNGQQTEATHDRQHPACLRDRKCLGNSAPACYPRGYGRSIAVENTLCGKHQRADCELVPSAVCTLPSLACRVTPRSHVTNPSLAFD